MTTSVDLCNLALLRIGTRSTITSFTDGSTEATACGLIYPTFLDAVFGSYDWKFARIRTALTSSTSSRAEWQYENPLPSDCVRLSSVDDANVAEPDLLAGQFFTGRIPFANGYSPLSGGVQVVWTNTPLIQVEYISNAITIGAWLPAFTEAFTWGLAVELSIALTSNGAIQERLRDQYGALLQVAQDMDTNAAQVATQGNEPWVDIANQALVMLGSTKVIRSVSDGTIESMACAQMYPTVVNEVFGLYDWRFARKRAVLVSQANTSTEWFNEYELPADCVRVRRIINPYRSAGQYREDRRLFDPPVPYAIGYSATNAGQAVWCNIPNLASTMPMAPILDYTSNLPLPATWQPALRSAIVVRLASQLAFTITKDARIAQLMQQQFDPLFQRAIAADGAIESATAQYTPDWLQVRDNDRGGDWGL